MKTKTLKTALLFCSLFFAALSLSLPMSASNKGKSDDSKKVIRILAIGNSFSEDAIEQNLYEIAEAAGVKLVIGNLYHGGCSLEQHYTYLKGDKPEYRYRKVVDGVKTDRPKTTLNYGLEDEDWDYVSFQQASHYSGMIETYQPYIGYLVDYVKTKVRKDTKMMWHMTWAYAANATHEGFMNYGRSQLAMYNAILKATRYVLKQRHFDVLIPCGTTIQNARSSYIGDNMCRDGFHMQYKYGRYAVACTWFEAITGISVVGNKYAPEGVDERQRLTIQKAVHKAIKHPFKVKDMKGK